jgi:hypothetical protein
MEDVMGRNEGFRCEYAERGRDVLEVRLFGFLREEETHAHLEDFVQRVEARAGRTAVLYRPEERFDFDLGCLRHSLAAYRRIIRRLRAVAVAPSTGNVRLAVQPMAMLLRLPMRGFARLEDAERWLESDLSGPTWLSPGY